jgi:ribosome-associated protein
MISVTASISIDEKEIREEFVHASGPGGQNVNKVATAVQLRFDVVHSPSLPPDVRERAVRLVGSRITGDGVLVIDARRFRTQGQNRKDARDRFLALIRRAADRPEPAKERSRHRLREGSVLNPSVAARKKRSSAKVFFCPQMRRGGRLPRNA